MQLIAIFHKIFCWEGQHMAMLSLRTRVSVIMDKEDSYFGQKSQFKVKTP